MAITEYFERFQYFNFETNFLNVNPLQKTGVPLFSHESRIKKGSNYKERRFASNYFTFSKKIFQFKNLV